MVNSDTLSFKDSQLDMNMQLMQQIENEQPEGSDFQFQAIS